jgi:hypothetical protein
MKSYEQQIGWRGSTARVWRCGGYNVLRSGLLRHIVSVYLGGNTEPAIPPIVVFLSNRNPRGHQMKCFVCGANAEKIATTIDAASILCPVCGEYDVSSSAIVTGQMEKLEPGQRRDALLQAKRSAQPGTRPMIDIYLLA